MTQQSPQHLIRPEIQQLSAYHVPPAVGLIKLDAMENPYQWSSDLQSAWSKRIQSLALNRYPDPAATTLVAGIRSSLAVPDDQGILLGNGSDELIQMIAMAVAVKGRFLLAPEPGFVMYRLIAEFVGLEYLGIPLNAEDFSLDMPAMLKAIREKQPAVIFLAYPNNPTGNHWRREDIEAIIEVAEGLVVLDEAYAPFAADSFMQDLGKTPNLLVMRTLSKFGLAGIRLGYLCGAPAWLQEFDKLRLPYNINVMTQVTAEFALEHRSEFDRQAELIKQSRHELQAALGEFPEFTVFPSDANFILFRTAAGGAGQIFDALLHEGILIKNLSPAGGLLTDCLRVTVGKTEENQALIAALSAAVD